MKITASRRLFLLLLVVLVSAAASSQNESKLDYTITLADAALHRVHVNMTYDPESGGHEVQLPVWNALYQVRDFSKNVMGLRASSQSGEQLAVRQIDKTTWEFGPKPGWVVLDYDIVLDEPGPFGAQFNEHHAFLNLAQVLMYPVNGREFPVSLRISGMVRAWKLATALPSSEIPAASPSGASGYVLHADNYDRLVDSPCELGQFAEVDFEQGGAKYRIVIDANPGDYELPKLLDSLKRITAAEVEWMNDRPFDSYVFIYHLPRGPAGGGMEHASSTAIDHSASDLRDLRNLDSVSAHEFFHLWNVKRLRPQSLEPIDYTHENYTRALWFSEGVTSSVADLVLLKAGLMQSADYFRRLGEAITVLQGRPAHLFQSVEESSLDAWLEKYPSYRAPERSISYYNKGEILGVLLDLKLREDSHGQHSLRDLFQAMNRDYAKQGKFFADSDGVRLEAQKLTGTDLQSFFDQYVAGTAELPYDQLFATAGLSLSEERRVIADPGFGATRNFRGPLIIDEVYGDQARSVGLQEGDEIIGIQGQSPLRNLEQQFANLKPGTKVSLTVLTRGLQKDVQITLGERQVEAFVLRESPQANREQIARRNAWLTSENQPSASSK